MQRMRNGKGCAQMLIANLASVKQEKHGRIKINETRNTT